MTEEVILDRSGELPLSLALAVMRPNNRWSMEDENLSKLDWLDDPAERPTDEEIIAKAQEIKDGALLRLLRRLRDDRMREVDWVIMRSVRTGEPISQEWKDYMQALADITKDLTGITMSGNSLFNVKWPTRPDGVEAGTAFSRRLVR